MGNNTHFKYESVLKRGRPVHDPLDPFSIRHPPMPLSRRAKIFSPFAALKGYDEAIAAKTVQYSCRRELDEEERRILDQKIALLRKLTYNSRIAAENTVAIQIEYFVPCPDPNHEAYEQLGTYETITGVCMGVDMRNRAIRIDDRMIAADDISDIVIENVSV